MKNSLIYHGGNGASQGWGSMSSGGGGGGLEVAFSGSVRRLTSEQTIPDTTNIVVDMNTIVYDADSTYSLTNDEITIPEDLKDFHYSATLHCRNQNYNGQTELYLYVDRGSGYAQEWTDTIINHISFDDYNVSLYWEDPNLNSGDKIQLLIGQYSGQNNFIIPEIWTNIKYIGYK